jgi:hypothetical protein
LQAKLPAIDPAGLDLLKRMIQYQPQLRISAKEALSHPYFHEIHVANANAAAAQAAAAAASNVNQNMVGGMPPHPGAVPGGNNNNFGVNSNMGQQGMQQ